MTLVLRWSTFLIVAITALAFMISAPFVIVVWQSNLIQLAQLNIPEKLLYDSLKGIVYIGLLLGPVPAGYAAIKGNTKESNIIWIFLSVFYALSSLVFFFPFDVNKNIAEALPIVGFFMILISALSVFNWFIAKSNQR